MHKEVHSQPVPRRRTQQGRIRLPRPLRIKVLRGQHQSVGEDARRGGTKAGRFGNLQLIRGRDEETEKSSSEA